MFILHWHSTKRIQQLSLLEMRLNEMVLLIWHQIIMRLWSKSFRTVSKKVSFIGKKEKFQMVSISLLNKLEAFRKKKKPKQTMQSRYNLNFSSAYSKHKHLYLYSVTFMAKFWRCLGLDDFNKSDSISHVHHCLKFWKRKKAVQVQPCILWVWLHSQNQKYCTQDHAYKNAHLIRPLYSRS